MAKGFLASVKLSHFLIYLLIGVLAVVFLIVVIWLFLFDKMYPFVKIGGTDVSLLTLNQAKDKVEQTIKQRLEKNIQFTYTGNGQSFNINLTPSDINLDTQNSLTQSFTYGHPKLYFGKPNVPVDFSFNPSFNYKLQTITTAINQPPIDSQIKVDGEQIVVTPSQEGLEVDENDLRQKIAAFVNTGEIENTSLQTRKVSPKLTYDTALKIKQRLDLIKLEPLKLTYKDKLFTLSLNDVLSLIDLQSSQPTLAKASLDNHQIKISSLEVGNTNLTDTTLTLNQKKVTEYFKTISMQIDRPSQEPLFAIENTADPNKPKIKEFQPPVEGQTLNITQATHRLTDALLNNSQKTVELPVDITSPKNKLVNDYGIKELIGRGTSNFAGSIENRIYNVGLAASRINGVLIAPGEEFSFVNTVGDISGASGYKQAYVIKSGRTVLDDGGGVCQVSTTIFRAALNSGLPITNRVAHAYRVGYYEQGYPPGIDATIFSPTVDFKFKNDTTHHVLVQSYVQGTSLTIDFYGTSDGRVANVSKPVITSQTPAPPEIRQDDPTLPKGTVKQVDWAAAGANVFFTRTVTRNGETLYNDTFRSNYRPWQAVYLVGTKEG